MSFDFFVREGRWLSGFFLRFAVLRKFYSNFFQNHKNVRAIHRYLNLIVFNNAAGVIVGRVADADLLFSRACHYVHP